MSALRRFWTGAESECGQAILIIAGSMTVLLLAVGLAIDAGQLFVARRAIQEAADAGAYAGAVVVYQGGTQAQALEAATADVTLNDYTHGDDGGNTTVTIRQPASGPYTGNANYVEVIISVRVNTSILPAIARAFTTVTARAVAGAEPLNSQYAVISLETGSVNNAVSINHQGALNITGAGMLINSRGNQAAVNTGNGTNISVVGGTIDIAGSTQSPWGTATVRTSQPQLANPFAGYPKPSTSGLTVHNAMPGVGGSESGNVITIYPGVWNEEITAASNKYIKLMPGIYILKAGVNLSGNGTLCSTVIVDPNLTPKCQTSNGGVFLFNTHDNYPSSEVGSCNDFRLTGNGRTTLFPMTTGTYAGMLIYQDDDCTNNFTISGNGELEASGTIYLPNATFDLNGNNATLSGSQIVALMIDVQNGNLALDFDPSTVAQPVLPRLAE